KRLTTVSHHETTNVNVCAAGPVQLPLLLTVAAAPVTPPPSVVVTPITVVISQAMNAATFKVTPLVAGSLATVMGTHFAGKNVAVTFDGSAATLLYVADQQINLQVPAAVASKTTASLVVTVDGVTSTPFAVTLAPAW